MLLDRIKSKCIELNLEVVDESQVKTTYHYDRFNVKCLNCGKIFEVNCKDILHRNRKCSTCKTIYKRYTLEFLQQKVNDFCLTNDYILVEPLQVANISQSIIVKHKSGGIKKIFLYYIVYGGNIVSEPYTFINKNDVVKEAILNHCNDEDITFISMEDYTNERTKITLQCNKCKKIWTTTYHTFVKQKKTCSCRISRYKETKETRENKIKAICTEQNYEFLGWENETYGVHSNIKIKCIKHNHIWCPVYKDFISGKGCLLCSNETNVYEQKFLKELKKKYPQIEIIYQYRNKAMLGRLSLDFYLPQYNIAIECQGEQHFRYINFGKGTKPLKTIQNNDYKKFQICTQNNIKLFYFSFSKRKYLTEQYFDTIHTSLEGLFEQIDKIIAK